MIDTSEPLLASSGNKQRKVVSLERHLAGSLFYPIWAWVRSHQLPWWCLRFVWQSKVMQRKQRKKGTRGRKAGRQAQHTDARQLMLQLNAVPSVQLANCQLNAYLQLMRMSICTVAVIREAEKCAFKYARASASAFITAASLSLRAFPESCLQSIFLHCPVYQWANGLLIWQCGPFERGCSSLFMTVCPCPKRTSSSLAMFTYWAHTIDRQVSLLLAGFVVRVTVCATLILRRPQWASSFVRPAIRPYSHPGLVTSPQWK